MNNTTESIIKRYLNSNNIPYAILLDGKWGTGKTWYIKNKFEKKFGIKLIYVSANGISSLEDLTQRILSRLVFKKELKKNPSLKLVASLAKHAIEGITKIDTSKILNLENIKDFVTLKKDEVLIIDDVERMRDGISMEDFLGYISTNFTEENNIKVILIADEGELLKKLDKKKDEYLRKKEKQFGKRLNII